MTNAHRNVTVDGIPMRLDDALSLDSGAVIHVTDDGSLSFHPEIDTPTVALFIGGLDTDLVLQDEYEREYSTREWVPETGWTGQYGYNGSVMHDSEFVGGRIADHVLSTPGYWKAVPADHYAPDEDAVSEGWVLLHKEDDES